MPEDRSRLAIVVPIFNRTKYISGLVKSLSEQTVSNFRIIIVDHGTKPVEPGSLPPSPKTHVIRGSPNLWFTGAVNLGLRFILDNPNQFSHVMIVNDDVIIPDRNWLEILFQHSGPKRIVAPMGLNLEGTVEYAGINFNSLLFKYCITGRGLPLNEVPTGAIVCDALPSRGILFSFRALQSIGLLDEIRFPHYASDFEWTERARKAGYELILVRKTHVRTESNEDLSKYSSGRIAYPHKPLRSFIKDLLSPHKSQNFFDLKNFSSAVFSFPYSTLYLFVNLTRKVGGFILTNYLRRASHFPEQKSGS